MDNYDIILAFIRNCAPDDVAKTIQGLNNEIQVLKNLIKKNLDIEWLANWRLRVSEGYIEYYNVEQKRWEPIDRFL